MAEFHRYREQAAKPHLRNDIPPRERSTRFEMLTETFQQSLPHHRNGGGKSVFRVRDNRMEGLARGWRDVGVTWIGSIGGSFAWRGIFDQPLEGVGYVGTR